MNWLLLVLITGLYIVFVRAVFRFVPTPRSRAPTDRFLTGAMSRDDDRCWYGGGFLYYWSWCSWSGCCWSLWCWRSSFPTFRAMGVTPLAAIASLNTGIRFTEKCVACDKIKR